MDIETHTSNGISYTQDEAYYAGVAIANSLCKIVKCNFLFREWYKIFRSRNYEYGTSTWVDLGIANVVSAIYSKYQRMKVSSGNIDACIDIFGYSVLMCLILKKLGIDIKHTQDDDGLDLESDIDKLLNMVWRSNMCSSDDVMYYIIRVLRGVVLLHPMSAGEVITKPWGYEEINWKKDGGFIVKTLYVFKGERLSLQYHNEKTEWLNVMEGVGVITISGISKKMHYGESILILPKIEHRIEASSALDFVLLEVSTPDSMDDTIRIHDDYGRK